MSLHIISANVWGRRLRGLPTALDRDRVRGLVVHYTGVASVTVPDEQVASYIHGIQEHHLRNTNAGWVTIAYNYLIDKSGRIWEGRGLDFINGANRPANKTTMSVCLLNGVHDNEPTADQIEAIRQLRVHLEGELGRPIAVSGHRDHSSTACPGEALYRHVTDGTFEADPAQHVNPVEGTPIVGWPSATIFQAWRWAEENGAHPRFGGEIIPALFRAADRQRVELGEGIDPAVLVAQAAKETGWGRFGGVIGPQRHNTAGIKVEDGGGNFDPDAHEVFDSWDEGARAHANHLGAYTGLPPIGVPHGRHRTVSALEWAGGIETVEELGARWAPNPDYGHDIARMVQELRAVQVDQETQPTDPEPAPARTYLVRRGDSWWRIAAQQLGDGNRWVEVAEMNGKVPLHPGMTVRLP